MNRTKESAVVSHLPNAPAILAAILQSSVPVPKGRNTFEDGLLRFLDLSHYQRFLLHKFGDVVVKRPFDYISKAGDSWLIVGDRRPEIAADILLIVERYGLGVGMLVLHMQQIQAGHVLTHVVSGGRELNLATPTESLAGANH
jgi:hypothetical protein